MWVRVADPGMAAICGYLYISTYILGYYRPMTTRHQEVLPVSQVRIELSSILNNFSTNQSAEPVYLGAHRKAEGVLIPISMWENVLNTLEDIEIAKIIRQRKSDPRPEVPFEKIVKALGLNIPKNT